MDNMKKVLSTAKAAKEAPKGKDTGKKGKAGEKVAGALFQKLRKGAKL